MAIFTAIAAGAAMAGTTAATVGMVAAGVGAVGSAYAQMQSAKVQKQTAAASNARERRKQLASLRKAQRMNEFMGAATGTTGSSSQAGQAAAFASNTASNIGEGFMALSAAREMSKWNNMATGFGALSSVGQTLVSMPGKVTNPGTFDVKTASNNKALPYAKAAVSGGMFGNSIGIPPKG